MGPKKNNKKNVKKDVKKNVNKDNGLKLHNSKPKIFTS